MKNNVGMGFLYYSKWSTSHSAGAHPHVEDTAGVGDGLAVGLRVSAAAAHVEANPDDVEAQLPCTL